MNLSLLGGEATWSGETGSTTRVYLLRHGEVEEQWQSRLYGQLDVPLSDFGRKQSEVTGKFLRAVKFTAIYSSDLARAELLGRELGKHHGLSPQLSPHLRERKFGNWQGHPWAEIEEKDPIGLRQYMASRYTMRAPGDSENFVDVSGRVIPFMKEILARHHGQTIAITCHSGPARVIIAAALGMPLEGLFSFDQDYCCLNILDIHDGNRIRLKHLNLTHHLDRLYKTRNNSTSRSKHS